MAVRTRRNKVAAIRNSAANRGIVAKRGTVAVAGALGLAMALSACSSDDSDSSSGSKECAAYSQYGNLKGKSVSILTSITTPEDISQKASYKPFEKCTGAKIKYEGNQSFEDQLRVRTAAGNPPDIAYVPQPGLLAQMVATGKAKPAPAEVGQNTDKFWTPEWKTYGSVNGTFYSAPLGANVKSFIWYSPNEFKQKGYTIPTTLAELYALSDKIAASGKKPWCAGIGSDAATGWVATDWMEDMMLRLSGPEEYDKWVKHEIAFNSPGPTAALDEVGKILKNPKYVNGGLGDVKSIASTSFKDGGLPILEGQCSLHRQATFYAANWPAGTKVAPDGDVFAFYMPSKDTTTKPVLGAAEFVLAFSDRPEVKAFQTYLSTDLWANNKAKATPAGGWISANKGLDVSNLTSPIDKESVETLRDPKSVFRFDASDQMPGAVGAGSFWTGTTKWITGQSTKTTLDNIEKSWPKK
jgi:alpha-glucoside transport system substrate-binding protein